MVKYGRLISSESFVYLEKSTVLAKHRQLLMPALFITGVCVLLQQKSTLSVETVNLT